MKKNEMVKEIEDLINLVNDKDFFSEKYELKDGEYYPFAHGYLLTSLQNILDCAKNKN